MLEHFKTLSFDRLSLILARCRFLKDRVGGQITNCLVSSAYKVPRPHGLELYCLKTEAIYMGLHATASD